MGLKQCIFKRGITCILWWSSSRWYTELEIKSFGLRLCRKGLHPALSVGRQQHHQLYKWHRFRPAVSSCKSPQIFPAHIKNPGKNLDPKWWRCRYTPGVHSSLQWGLKNWPGCNFGFLGKKVITREQNPSKWRRGLRNFAWPTCEPLMMHLEVSKEQMK